MNAAPLRVLAATALAFVGGTALAENYVAQIYGKPAGFDTMEIYGAGDNGLMSGASSGPSQNRAGYMTSTGFRNMHPSGWLASQINDSWGSTYHCGSGAPSGGVTHALFWLGGGAAVDLHPAGIEYGHSRALGGGGQLQAGYVEGDINCTQCGFAVTAHAALWSKTAMSFRRMHCTTHYDTYARATDGIHVAGEGFHRIDNSLNAIVWHSITSPGTNIRPSGSTESSANTVWGYQQAGWYRAPAFAPFFHAVLWTGTAASAVDLNPNATFNSTQVKAMKNGLQVGYGLPISQPNRNQAIAWHGTAGSWINLHAKLPYPYNLWKSFAEGIDGQGNVTGFFGLGKPAGWILRLARERRLSACLHLGG